MEWKNAEREYAMSKLEEQEQDWLASNDHKMVAKRGSVVKVLASLA